MFGIKFSTPKQHTSEQARGLCDVVRKRLETRKRVVDILGRSGTGSGVGVDKMSSSELGLTCHFSVALVDSELFHDYGPEIGSG